MLENLLNGMRAALLAHHYNKVIQIAHIILIKLKDYSGFKDNLSAIKMRAAALLKLKDFQKAIDDVNFVESREGLSVELRRIRAKSLFELKRYRQAYSDAIALYNANPKDKIALEILIHHTYHQCHYHRMLHLSKSMHERYPESLYALSSYAVALFHLNDHDKAYEISQQVLEREENNYHALHIQLRVKHLRGQDKDVVHTATNILKLYPNTILAYVYRGHAFANMGYKRSALQDLLKAKSLDETHPEVCKALAFYYEHSDMDLAFEYAKAYEKRGTFFPELNVIRAEYYLAHDMYEKVIKETDSITLADEKDQLNLYLLRAEAMLLLGESNELNYQYAISVLNQAENIDAECWSIYFLRAQCQFRLGQLDEALNDVNQAFFINNEILGVTELKQEILLAQAEDFLEDENYTAAISVAMQIIQINDGHPEVDRICEEANRGLCQSKQAFSDEYNSYQLKHKDNPFENFSLKDRAKFFIFENRKLVLSRMTTENIARLEKKLPNDEVGKKYIRPVFNLLFLKSDAKRSLVSEDRPERSAKRRK